MGCIGFRAGVSFRLRRQILEELLRENIVDFPVAGNRLGSSGFRVVVNVVAGTVAQQMATCFFHFGHEIPPFHAISSSSTFRIPGMLSLAKIS